MHRALIVIDAQNEYFNGPLAIQHPSREDSLTRITEAIEAAQAHCLTVAVLHENPPEAPVFAAGSTEQRLHPSLETRTWAHRVTKRQSSALTGTDLADWLDTNAVDTITLAGYMTNNCVLATAADAAQRGLTVEVLSDATGAIHLANEAGTVPAHQVQTVTMVLLQSNFAAVATTSQWRQALTQGVALPKSNLVASATLGAQLPDTRGRPSLS